MAPAFAPRAPAVPPSHRSSISKKIVLGISTTVLAVSALVIVPAAMAYRQDLVRAEAEGARTYGALLADHAAGAPLDALLDAARAHPMTADVEARVLAPDGRPVLPERTPPWLHRLIRLRLPAMMATSNESWPWFEAGGFVHVLVPHRGPDGGVDGAIHVERRLDGVNRQVLGFVTRSLAGLVAAVVLIGAVSLFSVYRVVLKPLQAMVEANRAITEGRGQATLVPEEEIPNDELGDIMRVRNQIYQRMVEYQNSIKEKSKVLEQQRAELDGWGRELERRLAEKTAELVQAHDQLVRAEKLAAMGRLAAGVAHEINNPLASILGYAEDLRDLQGADREALIAALPSSLKVIEDQAMRCKRITRQLLNFARESSPSVEPVDLCAVVRDTLPLVELRARRADVPLRVEAEAGALVATDPSQLQHVLINLIDNAVDACAAKGNGAGITVRTRTAGDEVVVEVEDQGTGIAEADRPKVFDPFFTTKPPGQGVGLGLSICYGIVSRLRGRIDFTTAAGEGTTFRVYLPVILGGSETGGASAGGARAEPAPAPSAAAGGEP